MSMDRLLRGDVSAYKLPRGLRKVLPLGSSVARARIHSFCRRHGVPVREGRRILLAKKAVGGYVRTRFLGTYLAWGVPEEDPGIINLSEEEKDPGIDLLTKEDMKNISGPVRNQCPHNNCWSHVATDMFSGFRLLTKQDTQFCSFSTKHLTYYADEGLREARRIKRQVHLCHPFPVQQTFRFMQGTGVPKRYPDED